MKKVIFIGGTAYSGSTMLDMILSYDEKGYSLGEVNALFRPYRPHHFDEINAVKKNKMWNNILEAGEKDLFKNIFNSHPNIEFLVDSSKDPFWIADQSRRLQKNEQIEVKHILIYKTPMEIAHSYQKRNLYEKWERSWVNYYRLYFSLVGDFKTISYEDLVTNTEILKTTCEYLDISYFSNKQEFWNKKQTTFFGNNRTRFHTDNLDQKGEEKRGIDRDEHRKIYYKKVDDEEIIQKVETRIHQNHFIPMVLSTLTNNKIPAGKLPVPSSLNFGLSSIFIRKIKNKIKRLKAQINN